MLHLIGTFLLMMRLFFLVSRQLEFCIAMLTTWVITSGPPAGSLWRLDPGGGVQPRQLVPPLNLTLFLVGLPHGVC